MTCRTSAPEDWEVQASVRWTAVSDACICDPRAGCDHPFATGLDHGILAQHSDCGLQRLPGAGSVAEQWWPSALLRSLTGRPCSGRAMLPPATCCSGGCARCAAPYSAARIDFSVLPFTGAALKSFHWAGARWDCTWHVNIIHHSHTFHLVQGSDADLGLPPMADSTSKARRRPLDIVQQSEQPRVCFQVYADALGCKTLPCLP